MKRTLTTAISLLLTLLLLLCPISCNAPEDPETPATLWDQATYKTDTTLGTGAKSVQVEVKVDDNSMTFTILTDAETLGEALKAHNLIEGVDGLYTKVNGMVVDYNVDQHYWGFFKDGEMMMVGLDSATVTDGDHYELIRTK